jgi:crotonobetainyl-CoA:carnitine CoA-transferase CaiB-like acyl-CoA transferase
MAAACALARGTVIRGPTVWAFQTGRTRNLSVTRILRAEKATGPLAGLRVLDLSRILAGPSATMLMADMGATITKVEALKTGDDTRRYAPPFIQADDGVDSDLAAYFSSCNRNKLSLALNFKDPEGQKVLFKLLETSDVLIENFKTGTLAKYGLGYDQLKDRFPGLVYCSVTGFGHTGPYSKRPAYDMLIQAMGGSMSITGVPDGEPMKMGLSMFDLTAGLHAVIGILAAIRDKSNTGLGQHVDISMLDVSVALLQNQGMNYLAKKQRQPRVGNNHPNVVPYQVMPSQDGYFILTASNDEQFGKFCKVAGREDLMEDERFATMKARVVHRSHVTPALNEVTKTMETAWWLKKLELAGVGCAPILHPDEVFADPHVLSREMLIEMNVPGCSKPVSLIGSPMKFSRTKVNYRYAPPRVGEHSDEILAEAGYSEQDVAGLRACGAVGERPEGFGDDFVSQALNARPVSFDEVKAVKDAGSKSWADVRSVSVPNASAHLADATTKIEEKGAGHYIKTAPMSPHMLGRLHGSTWDSVKSMSVPTAASMTGQKDPVKQLKVPKKRGTAA